MHDGGGGLLSVTGTAILLPAAVPHSGHRAPHFFLLQVYVPEDIQLAIVELAANDGGSFSTDVKHDIRK